MSDTPAGWHDDGSGRRRWWDGRRWTERFADQAAGNPDIQGIGTLVNNIVMQSDPGNDPDAIWAARGKPLTGLGIGKYKLTTEYLFFEKGTFSTKAQQIRTGEIHDVDASQSMTQKARGLGTITLWTVRTNGDREKVTLDDIVTFREGVDAINRQSHEARQRARKRENTQYVNYSDSAMDPIGPRATAVAPADADLNTRIAQLAEFKAQGVLTDEEFTAAKRRLLDL